MTEGQVLNTLLKGDYMHPNYDEIEKNKDQLINKYRPIDIILFGSCAETANKREMVKEMLISLDYDVDLDIVIYTPSEWSRYRDDRASFANVTMRTGVSLVG
jgi:predicted nucleotidyltransferase